MIKTAIYFSFNIFFFMFFNIPNPKRFALQLFK